MFFPKLKNELDKIIKIMTDINHNELINKFSYMETSENLFKIKDGNYFYWDIVR